MNIRLLEELYSKYIFKDRQSIKSNWHLIIEDYKEATGEDLVLNTARKQITPDIRERLWEDHIEGDTAAALPPNELEIGGDGTRKLLAYKEMTEEESKDPDAVMRMNGYNPQEWELVKLKVSEWTMGVENQNYSIGLEVRPKTTDKLTIDDIIKANKEFTFKHDKVEYKRTKTDRAIEIALADLHIGSESFDEQMYREKINEIRAYCNREDIEEVYLVFYGDILHVDNTNNTTVKGTQLEVEGSAFDMYRLGKEILNFTVAKFSDLRLNVISVQGNHSYLAEFAIFDALKDAWSENDHISFDVGEKKRKAFLYGNQLVGMYHGDMPKRQQFDWLARDFREMWGKAKFVEQHSGHLHHESVETKGAITSRTLNTIKKTDEYEVSMGYKNVKRVIQTFIYDKVDGLKHIGYF